ncbi:MAG: preprotein translocase subunit SecE [Dehalococcoidia bacterium]|nr:preprotein translocase subunit SecE [Dehalococcoidia bacterium]
MKRPTISRGNRPGLSFIKETIAELRKVTWPTRREATRLTILVIIISAAVGLALGAIDLGLTQLSSVVLGIK